MADEDLRANALAVARQLVSELLDPRACVENEECTARVGEAHAGGVAAVAHTMPAGHGQGASRSPEP